MAMPGRRRIVIASGLILGLVGVSARPADAAPQVTAEYLWVPAPQIGSTVVGTSFDGVTDVAVAERFTASIGGPLLSVDFFLSRESTSTPRDLTAAIRPIDPFFGRPGIPLAEVVIPAAAVPLTRDYVTVDFSTSGVVLEAGTDYAVSVEVDPPSEPPDEATYHWYGEGGDPYPEGESFRSFDGGTWVSSGGVNDWAFSVVVDGPTPPVPLLDGTGRAVLGALLLGFGAIGSVARIDARPAPARALAKDAPTDPATERASP